MKDKIYGYVYLITNLVNYRMYVGKHKYPKAELDPSYFCSSTSKKLKSDIKKYGKDNFEKELLMTCDTLEDLNSAEIILIEYYRYKYGRDNIYNISNGGDGGITWIGYKYSDPDKYNEILNRMAESISKGLTKYFSDPDNRKKHRERCNTEKAKDNYSLAGRRRWDDEDFRSYMMSIRSNEDYRMSMSRSIIDKWKDPIWHQNQVNSHNTDSAKLKSSIAAKRGHSDPELAAKYRHPNKKYRFRLPDGTIRLIGKRKLIEKTHPDWVLLDE